MNPVLKELVAWMVKEHGLDAVRAAIEDHSPTNAKPTIQWVSFANGKFLLGTCGDREFRIFHTGLPAGTHFPYYVVDVLNADDSSRSKTLDGAKSWCQFRLEATR